MIRTRLLGVWLAVLLVALLSACKASAAPNVPAPVKGLTGRIVWPKDGDLWSIDLATQQQTRLTQLSLGAAVTGASWSPDAGRVVFAEFGRRNDEKVTGSDLWLANADGSNAQLLADRGDNGSNVLETPQWLPSGSIYYGQRLIQAGAEVDSVQRLSAPGTPSETVVPNAYFPAASPDESTLLYVQSNDQGQQLMKMPLAPKGRPCVLVPAGTFATIGLPRISPDGQKIAVPLAGSGSNTGATCGAGSPTADLSVPLPPPSRPASGWLGLGPSVAWAHGVPFDIYVMNIDGSGLTKVADIKEDEPNVTWSPDGSKLAIFGTAALYLVDAKGGPVQKILDQGGYGGLDWAK